MNVQDVIPGVGAMNALQTGSNEKDVLQFCLADYTSIQQQSVMVNGDRVAELPDLVLTDFATVVENPAFDVDISQPIFASPQNKSASVFELSQDAILKPEDEPIHLSEESQWMGLNAIQPEIINLITPPKAPIIDKTDSEKDSSQPDNVNAWFVNAMPSFMVNDGLVETAPTQAVETLVGKEDVANTKAIKTSFAGIPPTSSDIKPDVGVDENSEDSLTVHDRDTGFTVAAMNAEKETGNISQKSAEYDAVMNTLADYINKNISIPEGLGFKTSPNSLSTSRDSYSNVEKRSDLQTSQYSVTDAGASLKIEAYTAKIKVYPPDLGQVTAEIIVKKGMAELTLTADNRHVKDFIQTNLPQLRETFLDSNITLTQVSIQNNSAQDKQHAPQHQAPSNGVWGELASEQTDQTQELVSRRQSDSMVDTYI